MLEEKIREMKDQDGAFSGTIVVPRRSRRVELHRSGQPNAVLAEVESAVTWHQHPERLAELGLTRAGLEQLLADARP